MSDKRHLNLTKIPQVVTATATGNAALENPDWLQIEKYNDGTYFQIKLTIFKTYLPMSFIWLWALSIRAQVPDHCMIETMTVRVMKM